MLKGTLFEELIATVERVEEHAYREQSLVRDERLTYFYTLAQQEIAQLQLAGVA
jgi:hypothetical protein